MKKPSKRIYSPEEWAASPIDDVSGESAMLRELESGGVPVLDEGSGAMFRTLEALTDYNGEDMAFADWLATSDVSEQDRAAVTGYVEGFNAADARRIGVRTLGAQQRAEDESEGDRAWHVREGYQALAEHLATRVKSLGSELRMVCEVRALRWRAGHVCVETGADGLSAGIVNTGVVDRKAADRANIYAKYCVVTLPLGVLQRANQPGGVILSPEPAAIAQARRLAMGHAVRFTMKFRERWWERVDPPQTAGYRRMSFLFTPQREIPVWWTTMPEQTNLLTGWVGGPRAESLLGRSAEELGALAIESLAEVFQLRVEELREQLIETSAHDWSEDVFARGAYSYVPSGALDAPAAMTVPEADTIFFAGEHTDVTANWGTVHAAIRSGLRAAHQVLGEHGS